MKRSFLLILVVIIIQLSCKEDGIAPPPKNNPPGWQEDIPWPSLADSPWPMNHHDPQNTGRSKGLGPQLGILETVITTPELYSGFAISSDSVIYFTSSDRSNGGLFAYSIDGQMKWFSSEGGRSWTAPICSKDGTIYYLGQGALVAINPNGSLKWEYPYQNQTMKLFSMDRVGNLYFLDGFENRLKIINRFGNLVNSISDPDFSSALNLSFANDLSFSPDGLTLYISGAGSALTAIDITNPKIKWHFGIVTSSLLNGSVIGSLIDCEGNIYFQFADTTGDVFFVSLDQNGNKRWQFPLSRPLDEQATLDKYGNLYFATDTLYSINISGNLRWKFPIDGFLSSSLVNDVDGNLYLSVIGQSLRTIAFSRNGDVKWILNDSSYGTLSSSPAIFNDRLYLPSNNNKNYYIIR
ncbi:MAG: PQQ-like beta-propeller repeat protein [Ignavibacteriales bacterium]|nr:MAG: PQQ-like beta-propeller repeat protein [Ignavibacteriales bacterium]